MEQFQRHANHSPVEIIRAVHCRLLKLYTRIGSNRGIPRAQSSIAHKTSTLAHSLQAIETVAQGWSPHEAMLWRPHRTGRCPSPLHVEHTCFVEAPSRKHAANHGVQTLMKRLDEIQRAQYFLLRITVSSCAAMQSVACSIENVVLFACT